MRADSFPAPLRKALALDSELAACPECRAIWEPHPETYVEDAVCAEPCDNCAFRPGSPEQQDKPAWKKLIESLRPKHGDDLSVSGRFYCHKGVPIDMSKGPGNFLFPTRQLMLDSEPVMEDGKPKMVPDASKMRTCSGYLRMIWQHNGSAQEKRERDKAPSGSFIARDIKDS